MTMKCKMPLKQSAYNTCLKNKRYKVQNKECRASHDKAAKLVGKAINVVPSKTLSLEIPKGDRPDIELNVRPATRGAGSNASVSRITSAADQYNSYHFDEASTLKTY
jgi:hypothetical protein